jgi:lipoate-protein ligase A
MMSRLEWRVLSDGPRPAAAQMAFDERLASLGVPVARFFTWHPPAVSLGFKQPIPAWLRPSEWSARGLALVERPTGGGMAFHGSDVSLSVVVPRSSALPLEPIMRTVCQGAVQVCRAFSAEATSIGAATADIPTEGRITYCLTERSPYAVLIGSRKVGGFAVRRYPEGWLIQGSLLVRRLPGPLARALPLELLQRIEREAMPLSPYGGLSEQAVARHWSERWPAWWDLAWEQAPRDSTPEVVVSGAS